MSSAANESISDSPPVPESLSAEADRPVESSPDASPGKEPVALRPDRRRLQYFAAFRYLFDSPEWPQTLALGSICYFIPVFGQVALLGYYYEIVERLHRDPLSPCPTFNFRRFATYSTRGVWSYLLVLAITSLLQVTIQIPLQYTIMGIIFAFGSSNTTGLIVASISAVVWGLIAAAIFLFMVYVAQPLMLRGGLSQELRFMFRARWVAEYAKRVWLEILLVQALLFMAMCLLVPIGLMLFCIGVLPITMLLAVAGSHLTWQVYELALARGCEAIPLRPAEADEPPAVWPTGFTGQAAKATDQVDYPTSPSSSASP